MDDSYRALERASINDPSATARLARKAELAGRPSLALWSRALAEAPKSEDARIGYIGAGGFYAEPVRDEYLGPAWKLTNLPVNGEKVNIVYGRKLLQHKNHRLKERMVDEHLENSVAGSEENPGGVAITSTLLEGSVKLAMFEHRGAPYLRRHVADFQKDEFEKEARWRIAGKLTYTGEQATLEDIALNRTRHSRSVMVPELTNNYATLAPEQSEDQLGTIAQIPENLVPFLTELFGRDYARVIPALQYFTKRRAGNLSEIRLWSPHLSDRVDFPERALVLGCGNANRFGFGLDIGGGIVGPAVGWRSAQKKAD